MDKYLEKKVDQLIQIQYYGRNKKTKKEIWKMLIAFKRQLD